MRCAPSATRPGESTAMLAGWIGSADLRLSRQLAGAPAPGLRSGPRGTGAGRRCRQPRHGVRSGTRFEIRGAAAADETYSPNSSTASKTGVLINAAIQMGKGSTGADEVQRKALEDSSCGNRPQFPDCGRCAGFYLGPPSSWANPLAAMAKTKTLCHLFGVDGAMQLAEKLEIDEIKELRDVHSAKRVSWMGWPAHCRNRRS